jgi:hypothetical protein
MSSTESQTVSTTPREKSRSLWKAIQTLGAKVGMKWTRLKAHIGIYEPDLSKPSVVESFLVYPCKGTRLKAPLEVMKSRKHVFTVNIVMFCMIGIELYSNWKIGFALLIVYTVYLGRFIVKNFLSD